MKGVVGILGDSFCGSTFLNANLNTHPEIFGAGELCWVTNSLAANLSDQRARAKSIGCTQCGAGCPLFDPSNFPLSLKGLYHTLASKTGAAWICDSSKQPSFFREAMENNPETSFRFLVLVKDPRESAMSHVKRGFRKGDLNHALYKWISKHREIKAFCKGRRVLAIKTEDLIDHLDETLNRISSFLEINPSFSEATLSNLHQIAGNKEFLTGTSIKFNGSDEIKPWLLTAARKFHKEILFLGQPGN